MATYNLSSYPKFIATDSNGKRLAGGKLYSYEAGTATPLATYTNNAGGGPNTNPIILDSDGQCDLWLTEDVAYKLSLYDSNDVLQWMADDITINSIIAGLTDVDVSDNSATAWRVREDARVYLNVNTTNSAEQVAIGNTTTNPVLNILGSGAITATPLNGGGTAGIVAASATGLLSNSNLGITSGTFTAAPTGVTVITEVTINYVTYGSLVICYFSMLRTSNATTFTLDATSSGTPMPAALVPSGTRWIDVGLYDNSAYSTDTHMDLTAKVFTCNKAGSAAGWTASGTKGIPGNIFMWYV